MPCLSLQARGETRRWAAPAGLMCIHKGPHRRSLLMVFVKEEKTNRSKYRVTAVCCIFCRPPPPPLRVRGGFSCHSRVFQLLPPSTSPPPLRRPFLPLLISPTMLPRPYLEGGQQPQYSGGDGPEEDRLVAACLPPHPVHRNCT